MGRSPWEANVAKAEIPDWFDLKYYQEPISRMQWLSRIGTRVAYLEYKPLFRDITEQEEMFHFFSGICLGSFDLPENHIDPSPVKSMSAADLAVFSACWSSNQSWQTLYKNICKTVIDLESGTLIDEYDRSAELEKESVCSRRWISYGSEQFVHGTAITVNLNHDDETIKQAFSVWLAGQRSEMSERFNRPVNDDDFQKWQKYNVLAAFDLCQWAEIKGFRYTNKQLANALFPPDSIEFDERDVDMTERVRKLVRPLAIQCVTHETVRSLEAAVRLACHVGELESGDVGVGGRMQLIPARLLRTGKDLVEKHRRKMLAAREAE